MTRHAGGLLAALCALLILPALLLPNPFGTDGPVHIHWQMAFAREVMAGHLFPRWLPTMNQGFGSPSLFFYPPLLQGVGALFAPLLPGDAQAIRRLALALGLLSWLGAMGCRAWLRELGVMPQAALLGALLWLAAPYRAFVDTYQRCALAECASLCVLPWLAYGAVRLSKGERGSWALHAFAIAALAYAHMPGMVIGYLFVAGHAIALMWAEPVLRKRGELALALGSSALAGLVMAAPMLVPALSLLDRLVDTTAMMGERNQPHNWLLFSAKPWIDPVSHIMALGLLGVSLGLAAWWGRPAVSGVLARQRAVGWAMLATVGVVALLNTSLSLPFWELQTPVSRIQFPFRLLGASSLALSALAALAYDRLLAVGRRKQGALLWLLLAGMLLGDTAIFAYQRLRPRAADTVPPTVAQIMASNQDTSEYVLGDLEEAVGRFGARQALVVGGGDDARLDSIVISGRQALLRYQADQDGMLALRQFAFTGWQCRIDAGGWTQAGRYRLGPSPQSAQVPLCVIPAGRHQLAMRLPAPLPERIGLWLGFAGLAAVLASLLGRRRA